MQLLIGRKCLLIRYEGFKLTTRHRLLVFMYVSPMSVLPEEESMKALASIVALTVFLGGCTTLVHDPVKQTKSAGAHCSDSEWRDNSSLAVLPVPIVAFFVPHFDLSDIRADDYLRRCGEPSALMNRHVEVSRLACIPTGLTRIISLGIWQWCPANVTWKADNTSHS